MSEAEARVRIREAEARVRAAAQEFIDAMTGAVSCTVKQLQESGLVDVTRSMSFSMQDEEDKPPLPTTKVFWAKALKQQLTVVTSSGAIFEANMAKCFDGQIYLRDSNLSAMAWHAVESPNGLVNVLC